MGPLNVGFITYLFLMGGIQMCFCIFNWSCTPELNYDVNTIFKLKSW